MRERGAGGWERGARGFVERLRRLAKIVRTIIGAPDYDRYVAHMAAHHPGCLVLSRDAFIRERLDDRYSRPGSRCC